MRQNINIMVQKADREKSAVSTAALLSAELDINNIPTAKGCPKFKKIFFFLINGRDELFWGYFQKSNGYVFEFIGSFCAHPMVGSLCVPTPDCW